MAEVMISITLIVGGFLLAALVIGCIIFLIQRPLGPGRPKRAGHETPEQGPAPTR